MLKDFFESPEIAAIFVTKDSNNETVGKCECIDCARLRVGKQKRKRDQAARRTVRKAHGQQQPRVIMFSTRRAKMEDAQKIASFNEENVYYDYDDETGSVITKKHSAVTPFNGQSNLLKDCVQSKHNVDIDVEKTLQHISEDFGEAKNSEGYCPSDSAYDTNHDDFTGSLERLTIATDSEKLSDSERRKPRPGKTKTSKHESPYRRCRSNAICGRNCELCRGENSKIMNGNHGDVDARDADKQRLHKKSIEHFKFKVNNAPSTNSKHGLFASKNRGKDGHLGDGKKQDTIQGDMNISEMEGRFHESMRQKYIDLDIMFRDHENRTKKSMPQSPRSIQSEECYDGDTAPRSMANISAAQQNEVLSDELFDTYDQGPWDGHFGYSSANIEYEEQTEYYDAFSCGPHLLMLYDFKAEHEDDLSVYKGDTILLLDNRDRDWVWVMTQAGEEGYVPRSLTSPFHDCEECRQEEIRQQQLAMLSKNSSNQSTPRSSRAGSRSGAVNLELNLISPVSDQVNPRSDHTSPPSERRNAGSNTTSPRSNASDPWLDQISPFSKSASIGRDQYHRNISDDQHSSNTSSPVLQRTHSSDARNSARISRNLPTAGGTNVQSSSSSMSDEASNIFEGKLATLNSIDSYTNNVSAFPGTQVPLHVPAQNYTTEPQSSGALRRTIRNPCTSTMMSPWGNANVVGIGSMSSATEGGVSDMRPSIGPPPNLQQKLNRTFPRAAKPDYRYKRADRLKSEVTLPSHKTERAFSSAKWKSSERSTPLLTSHNDQLQEFLSSSLNIGNMPRIRGTTSVRNSITESEARGSPISDSSEIEDENIPDGSIRLIALSGFEATEKEQLTVVAGDVLYVDIKVRNNPQWLWAYSPRSKRFGLLPEHIVDQLKSSSV